MVPPHDVTTVTAIGASRGGPAPAPRLVAEAVCVRVHRSRRDPDVGSGGRIPDDRSDTVAASWYARWMAAVLRAAHVAPAERADAFIDLVGVSIVPYGDPVGVVVSDA